MNISFKSIIFSILTIGIVSVIILNIINGQEERQPFENKISEGSCLALNYHRVYEENIWYKIWSTISNSKELEYYSVYKEELDEHIQFLKDHDATFVTLDELTNSIETDNFPENCVFINFDDADTTVYDNAHEVIEKHQVPATVFVISNKVGESSFNNMKMATWDELRTMKDSGLWSFGSHTHDMHYIENETPVFFEVDEIEFVEDLKKSKSKIKKELDIEVESFAIPYGNVDEERVTAIKKAGFDYNFILVPNSIKKSTTKYYIDRILVDRYVFEEEIKPVFE